MLHKGFEAVQVRFELGQILTLSGVKLVKHSVVDPFGSLHNVFKHCGNLFLLDPYLYISLFSAWTPSDQRVIFLIEVLFIRSRFFLKGGYYMREGGPRCCALSGCFHY